MLFDLTFKLLKNFQIPLFFIPISDDRSRVDILHPILQTSLVLRSFYLFQMILLKDQYVIQG